MGAVGGMLQGVKGFAKYTLAKNDAEAIREQGEFQAAQAEFNKKVANFQAEDAINRGEKAAVKRQQYAKQLIGSIRAAAGAAGIEVDTGSSAQVQANEKKISEMDAATIRNNAAREAFGYKVEANQRNIEATIYRASSQQRARSTIATGTLDAIGDVTSGAVKIARSK